MHNLLTAVEKGLLQDVKAILSSNSANIQAIINAPDCLTRWTPLHKAAYHGHEKIVALLIDAGANINAQCDPSILGESSRQEEEEMDDGDDEDIYLPTPLHLAAAQNHTIIIKLLIDAGSKVNAVSSWVPQDCEDVSFYEATPLIFAAARQNATEAVKLLLSLGADPNAYSICENSALYEAVCLRNKEVVEALLHAGADPNAKSYHPPHWAIHIATAEQDLDMIKLLVEHGASLEVCIDHFGTPLNVAVNERNVAIAQFLVEKGADTNSQGVMVISRVSSMGSSHCDTYGTPLRCALEADHVELARLFLSYLPSVNSWEDEQDNEILPIHVAVKEGSLNTTRLLIELGADVNVRTIEDWAPLHFACQQGYGSFDDPISPLMEELLINAGSDPNAVINPSKKTPLHFACKRGKIEVCKLLIKVGAGIMARDAKGRTPLHRLVADMGYGPNHSSTLRYLLAAGAAVNAVNNTGETPLHVAMHVGQVDAISTLINAGADVTKRNAKGESPMEVLYECSRETHLMWHGPDEEAWDGFNELESDIAAILIAAGSREWQFLRVPSPGLERALVNVLSKTPEDAREVFIRLEGRVQKVVQEMLRCLHHYLPGYSDSRLNILKRILGGLEL